MIAYFQAIVDVMRKYCNNILLIPGLGYQSQYAGFAQYPVKGENIGYAVHCYQQKRFFFSLMEDECGLWRDRDRLVSQRS
ncbi:MAG: hypothetical protein IJ069_08605 [Prevotella sp.]|nr:hypothetical protein [Prevotella sp.]